MIWLLHFEWNGDLFPDESRCLGCFGKRQWSEERWFAGRRSNWYTGEGLENSIFILETQTKTCSVHIINSFQSCPPGCAPWKLSLTVGLIQGWHPPKSEVPRGVKAGLQDLGCSKWPQDARLEGGRGLASSVSYSLSSQTRQKFMLCVDREGEANLKMSKQEPLRDTGKMKLEVLKQHRFLLFFPFIIYKSNEITITLPGFSVSRTYIVIYNIYIFIILAIVVCK